MHISETLAFLSPAINKKNSVMPVLEHVRIQGNYAIAYDSELALCCPCELPFTASPHGWTLERAVKLLQEGYQVAQLPNGDLQFFSGDGGKYKVVVPCTTDEFPIPDFNYASPIAAPVNFRDALRKLLPFVFTERDEERRYLETILLRNGKAFATCKHTMAWCDLGLPPEIDVNIPRKAVEAMAALPDSPEWISCTPLRFVAIYSGGRFLSTPSVVTQWPASVSKITEPVEMRHEAAPLLESLQSLDRFVTKADNIYFVNGAVATERDGRGASCLTAYDPVAEGRKVAAHSITLAKKHAKKIGYQKEFIAWEGDGIEGRSCLWAAGRE